MKKNPLFKQKRQTSLDGWLPTPITSAEQSIQERKFLQEITESFDRTITATMQWLRSDDAREFYLSQQGRFTEFMETSGINQEWQRLIHEHATRGADVTAQIYEYARNKNMIDDVPSYTDAERRIFNKICDNSYELIKNVCSDHITGIRQKLVQDYAEGVHPTQTHLKEMELEPINGWSPQQRAIVISRTESARALNMGSLSSYQANGLEFVELIGDASCDECAEYMGKLVPVQEAMEIGVIHPNCKCTWSPVTQTMADRIELSESDVLNNQ